MGGRHSKQIPYGNDNKKCKSRFAPRKLLLFKWDKREADSKWE